MSDSTMKYVAPNPDLATQLDRSRRWFAGEGNAEYVSIAMEEHPRVDLAGQVLIDATLQEAVLHGARLDEAMVMGALANGVCLDDASLVGADFAKATLVEATLRRARGERASFRKATLTDAILTGADLHGAVFDHAHCRGADFEGANLDGASFVGASLAGANLSQCSLMGATMDRTVIDETTRFDGCRGIETLVRVSLILDGRTLTGDDAIAWIRQRSGDRPASHESRELVAFQCYLLSKMSASELVEGALHTLGITRPEMDRLAATARVFDQPGHAGEEYLHWLGPPISSRQLVPGETSEPFVGSWRWEFRLPLWPDVPYVVCVHPSGYAWGMQFELPIDTALPPELDAVAPWKWTANVLTRSAANSEVLEQWSHDLDVLLSFARPNGSTVQYRARFDFGLLQAWKQEGR